MWDYRDGNEFPDFGGTVNDHGIGIDFGIQVVTRYRFELLNIPALKERHPDLDIGPKDAMEVTLNNVIIPMLTTTLAA